jgi:hypothetical protein
VPWTSLLGLGLLLSALALAGSVGVRIGRDQERSRPLRTPADIARAQAEMNESVEKSLRLSRGLPRLHESPDTAPRIRRGRLRR